MVMEAHLPYPGYMGAADDPDHALIDAAKNWLAIDGLWFLAIEEEFGLDRALELDRQVWEKFSVIEARRIMGRLRMPVNGGLDCLEAALPHRLFHLLNTQEIHRPDPRTLLLQVRTCRTQAARERKNLPLFPCKEIGITDYSRFATTIDPRIRTECLTCPPDPPAGDCCCAWKFTLPPVAD